MVFIYKDPVYNNKEKQYLVAYVTSKVTLW